MFNMAFQVVKNLNQYFKACVVENWTQYFLRQKLARLHLKGARPLREEVVADTVQVLHLYRQQCAPNSAPSQLVIPESLKLMPIYVLAAFKTHAFKLLSTTR